ncbi:WD40-repeat-containing domain protein [Aspergillus californicus]
MLSEFLKDDEHGGSHLSGLYSTILQEAVPLMLEGAVNRIAIAYFKRIIGSLAVLLDSLSIDTLHDLLTSSTSDSLDEIFDLDTVEETLQRLACVLDIPEDNRNAPLLIFHPSFREFLLDKREPHLEYLQLDGHNLHENLLHNCLAGMTRHLRKDICHLSDPAATSESVDEHCLDDCLPLHVQYACKYWITHLQKLSDEALHRALADHGPVHDFSRTRILYWMEAMSLLGQVPSAVLLIIDLRSLFTNTGHTLTAALIDDTYRFLITNRQIIAATPLQLYCSALLFSPSKSLIRKSFHQDLPLWLYKPPGVPKSWSPSVCLAPFLSQVTSVAFSRDERLLASLHDYRRICIWDIATGFLRLTINSGPCTRSLDFSRDSERLVSGSLNSKTQLWDVTTGCLIHVFRHLTVVGGEVAFSHNGLLIGTSRTQAGIWDSETLTLRCVLGGHSHTVDCLSFSKDDNAIATGCRDGRVRIYNSNTGVMHHILDCCSNVMAWSDGDVLATAKFASSVVQLWNKASIDPPSTPYKTLDMTNNNISSLSFSTDGKLLATGTFFTPVYLWDTATWMVKHTLNEHSHSILQVKFSVNGQLLASTSDDGTLRLWNLDEDFLGEHFGHHQQSVSCVKFSPGGDMIASSAQDSTLRIFDAATEKTLCVVEGSLVGGFNGLSFSSDSSLVAVTSDDGIIRILNTGDWSLGTLLKEGAPCLAVSFSPDDRSLAATYRETSHVVIWNLDTWTVIRTLNLPRAIEWYPEPGAIEYSPNGEILACGIGEKIVLWYPWQEYRHVSLPCRLGSQITSMAFSPDCSVLAICGMAGDDVGESWDLATTSLQNITENCLVSPQMFLPDQSPCNWTIEGRWIAFSGNRILYLPDDRQVEGCDLFGNTIVIGSRSGIVTILKFRDLEKFVVEPSD